jgi:hypothetical protein
MRPLTLAVVLLCLVAPALGADEDMDTDLMQTIDDTAKSVTSNIDLRNPAAGGTDAQELQNLFRQVQAFYERRHDAPDAVTYARTSLDLAGRIERALAGRDYADAARAAADLTRTCRSCHDVYKPLS